MILAGDIGGTHTRIALFDRSRRDPVALQIYPSQEHAGLEEIVAAFLSEHPAELDAACFDVAGPVHNRRVKLTNLAWVVDANRIAAIVGLHSVKLVNDLAASAWGIAELREDDLETLNSGTHDVGGNVAIISAGTGLGEAGLFWDGERYHALSSEGAHTDFGPRSAVQVDLYRFLASEDSHVSYERVCSGGGLVSIYRFLRDNSRAPEPQWLTEAIRGGDAAAAISSAALAGRDTCCVEALDLMVEIYGAEAGNLALKILATGGIYIGGGIAARILPKLRDGRFLEALVSKGRFQALLRQIPVHVILNDAVNLFGAARIARAEPPEKHRRRDHLADVR